MANPGVRVVAGAQTPISVSVTAGSAVSVYAAADLSGSPITQPFSVTGSTDFYFADPAAAVTVSATNAGSSTVLSDVRFYSGAQFVVLQAGTPGPSKATTASGLNLGTAAASATTDFDAAGASKQVSGVNAQTGTAYTLVLGDAGKEVTMNNGSANTLTIPLNATVAFPVGTEVWLATLGAGTTTVAITATGTLTSKSSLVALAGAGKAAKLTKLATDTWLLTGDLS